jgi:hypothetical protein
VKEDIPKIKVVESGKQLDDMDKPHYDKQLAIKSLLASTLLLLKHQYI